MPGKSGRPTRSNDRICRELIVKSAVKVIAEQGADAVTVRNVCREADIGNGTFYFYFKNKDDLLMSFLKEPEFEKVELKCPLEDLAGRITELYMHLINRYRTLGLDFMKAFYSTGNRALSAYMGEVDGQFEPHTVMARSEAEMQLAKERGILSEVTDIHLVCMDLCTIVKGCVFEWCLSEGAASIEKTLHRIVEAYLQKHLTVRSRIRKSFVF
ncbi:MAG: TetR/AcrR family transcriptional regulator [Duodenibacillus sp.]|nr:TetR/AcrR family transcriptional regulator [Duodenibacillus sp.]